MKTQNKRVVFWRHGSHLNQGRDRLIRDPHSIGLELAAYLATLKLGYRCDSPLTQEDIESVKVSLGVPYKGGRDISISATNAAWDKAGMAQNAYKKEELIQLFEYPNDLVSTEDHPSKTDSLWWDGEKFYYCYRGRGLEEYPREQAQEDVQLYYNLKHIWPQQIEACRKAGLI